MNNMKEKTFKAEPSSTAAVSAFMEAETAAMGISPRAQLQLNVVIDEIVSNIVSYAYPGGDGDFSVGIFADGDSVCLRFTDSGVSFNPLGQETPKLSACDDGREIGGMGILMAKKLSDEMEYTRSGDKNVLCVRKKLI